MVYKIKQAIRRSENIPGTFSGNVILVFKNFVPGNTPLTLRRHPLKADASSSLSPLKRGYFKHYLKSYIKIINCLNSLTFSALYKNLYSDWSTPGCKIPVIPFIIFCSLILSGCGSKYSEEQFIPEWNSEEGYRWAELPVGEEDGVGLEKLPSSYTNITFNNDLSDELMDQNRILMNGSGVAAGDIDGDGLVDLYFGKLDGSNALYKNLGGFQFEEITEDAGVGHEGHFSTGAVFADVNGNGHLDLLVTTMDSQNTLYLNDGKGNFTLQENSGLGEARGSMTMALADITNNGYPDLYVVNYREINVIDQFEAQDLLWENTIKDGELVPPYNDYFTILDRGKDHPPERHEIGRKDELYLNNGDGTFTKLEDTKSRFLDQDGNPLGLYPDWGLSAKFQDLNGDGNQDLYVNNDFWTPDRIWMNQGDGTFRALDSLAIRNSSYYSMTVDFSDINRNGYTDIFTVEMLNDRHSERLRKRQPTEPIPLEMGEYTHRPRYNRNSLFLNRGDNTYAEISYYSGLESSDWSWATRFIDLDLDGYEDLLINNGFAYDFQDMDSQQQLLNTLVETGGAERGYIEDFIPLRQKNRIYRNNGNLRFTETSEEWGFGEEDISLGMAIADLNGDGVQDVVISRMNDEPAIFKNKASGPRIAVRLKGEGPNTQAIGAKVELHGGPVSDQRRQIVSGGDYLSGSDPLLMFAATPEGYSQELSINWPDGTVSYLSGLSANHIYEIEQSGVKSEAQDSSIVESETGVNHETLFQDQTDHLNHRHHEDEFDDFRVQPLLPKSLSRFGPGVAWLDLNGNGSDELIIGSGKGGHLGIFEYDSESRFNKVENELTELEVPGDQTGIVGWIEDESTHLVIGYANYETGTTRTPSALHFKMKNGQIAQVDSLSGVLSTTGPLAATDYSGDGAIDLFIGGRFIPGQYPRDATSRLFKNEGGSLKMDDENAGVFEGIGMVSGAVFVDFNQNGQQDLVVATEWGSLRLFENRDGIFRDQTEKFGLDQYKGLWQGIAAGDFNGDGYPDLVATNYGLNSPYQVRESDYPIKIFYGDFNRNQRLDIIESYYDEEMEGYVPWNSKDEYNHVEELLYPFQTHAQFSEATVEDILRTDINRIPSREVNTLQHMVFINNGNNEFEARPLPAKAQFTAGFSASVADFDNDGHEDIFLSQNFFAVADPQRKPRLDAGRGLLLRGDGSGNFETVEGQSSGITIYGEQRGSALSDFNRDGKTDLTVAQNVNQTRLLQNTALKQGIRVALQGPPQNRAGIGSAIQLVYEDDSYGPLRTLHAGSGYWSQNSFTQILGAALPVTAVKVFWFDGTEQLEELDSSQMEVKISYPD